MQSTFKFALKLFITSHTVAVDEECTTGPANTGSKQRLSAGCPRATSGLKLIPSGRPSVTLLKQKGL